MSRDNSGIKHTCPDIDKMIAEAENWDCCEECRDGYDAWIKEMKSMLEDLRKENGALRDWGNEQYDKVNELGSDIDDREKESRDLQNKLDEAEDEIDNLQAMIHELENQK